MLKSLSPASVGRLAQRLDAYRLLRDKQQMPMAEALARAALSRAVKNRRIILGDQPVIASPREHALATPPRLSCGLEGLPDDSA